MGLKYFSSFLISVFERLATKVLFRSKFFLNFDTVALSFLFDKYCPKDSSRHLQTNCEISFCFHPYLMLHAFAARFDVTDNLEKFLVFGVN